METRQGEGLVCDMSAGELTFDAYHHECNRKGAAMKFIRANMNDKTVRVQEVPQVYLGLGGRGL